MIDLFEHYETLPQNIQTLINENTEFHSYKECEEFVKKLNKFGYTCDYGFDAVPFNLSLL